MPRRSPTITKTHIQKTKSYARAMGAKYGMAILKFDGERTMISGDNKEKMQKFAKMHMGANPSYIKVMLVTAGKPPKRSRK